MTLRYAYNTNGLQSHRLTDALALLGDQGYHGVALTLDHMHLDPLKAGPGEVAAVGRLLKRHRLSCVIETGARFVLDPRRKHHPGLCDPDPLKRMMRMDLLLRSVEIAAELEAEVLNLATGPLLPGQDEGEADLFLLEGLREVLAKGIELGVPVALEPEPGHRVETLAQYNAIVSELTELRLTIDVSHVSVSTPEGTASEAIRTHASRLALVHIEDAPAGVHEHLPFGEGDLDVTGIVGALKDIEFAGICAVELSRHSHAAHELTAASLAALRRAEAGA
jgi:sugar phosphate isomerase/epimerase